MALARRHPPFTNDKEAGYAFPPSLKLRRTGPPSDRATDDARVLFYFAREAAGAAGTRLSLRPLFSREATFLHSSGAPRREMADACPLR